MLVVVAPGQGAQKPGMLTDWLADPQLAERAKQYSESSGRDLITLGTTADAETITDTANTQPLLVASALLSYAAIFSGQQLPRPNIVAGHSVGEFAAYAIAGVFDFSTAMQLVSVRATAMAEASAAPHTSMAAVVGGEREEILHTLSDYNLVPANVNSAAQIVVAGLKSDIDAFAANPPNKTRVVPLAVAGAFHTSYMESARQKLAQAVEQLSANDPKLTLLSNFDGGHQANAAQAIENLVTQVSRPVRWDQCQQSFAERGVTGILELFPGGVLTGLARREIPGVEVYPVKSPDDIAGAQEFVTKHAIENTQV